MDVPAVPKTAEDSPVGANCYCVVVAANSTVVYLPERKQGRAKHAPLERYKKAGSDGRSKLRG